MVYIRYNYLSSDHTENDIGLKLFERNKHPEYKKSLSMTLIIVCLLVSAMLLTGCGGKNNVQSSTAEKPAETVTNQEQEKEEEENTAEENEQMETSSSETSAPQEVPQLTVVTGDTAKDDHPAEETFDENYSGLTPAEVVEVFNRNAPSDINNNIHLRMEYPGRYPDDHTDSASPGGIREDRDEKGIDLVMWVDGLSRDVFLISMGDEDALNDYLLFLTDAKEVQTQYQKRISEYFSDISLRLRVIDDTESDGTIAVIEDGKIVYDTADAEELRYYLDLRDMVQGG